MQAAVTPDTQTSVASDLPATRSLQDLFYAVAHDFRRPIRQVVAFTSLLQDKADLLDDEGREWIECLAAAGIEAQLMLERFLVYSQLQSLEISPASVDIRELCNSAIAELKHRNASAKNITITGDGTIVTDERMIRTVLVELLDNALEYGIAETATVEILNPASNSGIQICVANSGAGIDPDQIEGALRAFGRLHDDQPDHVGLGLNICQGALERIQGAMAFESTQDTFRARISLP